MEAEAHFDFVAHEKLLDDFRVARVGVQIVGAAQLRDYLDESDQSLVRQLLHLLHLRRFLEELHVIAVRILTRNLREDSPTDRGVIPINPPNVK